MLRRFSIVLVACFSIACCFASAYPARGEDPKALPRSTPEAEGVSSAGIREYVVAADHDIHSMHSFMLVRHGKVDGEAWWKPQGPEKPHVLWSLSKSFTSTAVGLAIAEGKLSLDDHVLKFFPDDLPARRPSANVKSMRVSDLLRMSCGQQTEPPRNSDEPWSRTFLHHPVPFKPGRVMRDGLDLYYSSRSLTQNRPSAASSRKRNDPDRQQRVPNRQYRGGALMATRRAALQGKPPRFGNCACGCRDRPLFLF